MSKKLYLTDHVAQKVKDERKSDPVSTESAYVTPEQRVLDPALLDNSLMDRLPQPTGWRVLVMPYQGKAKTASGLFIPDEVRERESVATVVAYVLKLGPLAYKDADKFGPNAAPWCKQGQWVCIGRYSGSRFKIEGGEVRILNDDEVIATLLEPDDVRHI